MSDVRNGKAKQTFDPSCNCRSLLDHTDTKISQAIGAIDNKAEQVGSWPPMSDPALLKTGRVPERHVIYRSGEECSFQPETSTEDNTRFQERRASFDDSGQNVDPTTQTPFQPLIRSSSLRRATSLRTTLGKKQGLSGIASLMQSQSLDAILRVKRRSRRTSPSGNKSTFRSASVPSSPTRSLPDRLPEYGHTNLDVASAKPNWLPGDKTPLSEGLNSVQDQSIAEPARDSRACTITDDGSIEKSIDRRISFGSLPARTQSLESERPSSQSSGNLGNNEAPRRKISFGALPVRAIENRDTDRSSELAPGIRHALGQEDHDSGNEVSEDEQRTKADVFKDEIRAEAKDTSLDIRQRGVRVIPRPTSNFTIASGDKLTSKKVEIHPNTNFSSRFAQDDSSSDDEFEDMSDIRRAQKLAVNLSKIDSSTKNRSIRTIIRGDFLSLQNEAEQGQRRLRTYLVATDLSGEAAYALEWTIGTVLRDGDTLIAVYAVDQEVVKGRITGQDSSRLPSGDDGPVLQNNHAVDGKLVEISKEHPRFQYGAQERKATSVGVIRSPRTTEQERLHAIEEISQTCIQFLRKTKLQVRVGVEVVHCISPRHMITEAPTMVIVGSRGQSALKGVLLGSFSNYLVMKSSAPVMVARKKLRRAGSKHTATKIRLANNLSPNKRPLSEAVID